MNEIEKAEFRARLFTLIKSYWDAAHTEIDWVFMTNENDNQKIDRECAAINKKLLFKIREIIYPTWERPKVFVDKTSWEPIIGEYLKRGEKILERKPEYEEGYGDNIHNRKVEQ